MTRWHCVSMAGVTAVVFGVSVAAWGGSATDVSLSPNGLRCEYLVDPLGIDVEKPRLSWVLQSEVRGQKQTAYRILVAQHETTLAADQGDLWDSGKTQSGQSIQID